nr:phage tail tip lysozyme [Collimonas pratensis]
MPADSASVVQQLMRSGWTQAQAAGLAANFVHESNLNPNAVGDNGAAYGIGQWHADRQAEFKKKFGKDIRQSTLEEQIAFADYELRQGNETAAGKKLGGATTAAEAGAIVSKHYERPADKEGEAQKRAASAAALDASIKSDNALAAARVPTGASASAPVSGAAGNSTSTTDVKVGQINVQTQATDASGIAKSIGNAVAKHSFANQANTGLA